VGSLVSSGRLFHQFNIGLNTHKYCNIWLAGSATVVSK